MPDGPLFAAASAGELSTDEGLRTQVRRMLAHERAGDALVRFHAQWLGVDAVQGISPARSAYGPLYGLDPHPDGRAHGIFADVIGRFLVERDLVPRPQTP